MSEAIAEEPLRPDSVDAKAPRVWLLMGHKAGDNNQVLALAEALGWPFEIKKFTYRRYELLTNVFFGRTLQIDSDIELTRVMSFAINNLNFKRLIRAP